MLPSCWNFLKAIILMLATQKKVILWRVGLRMQLMWLKMLSNPIYIVDRILPASYENQSKRLNFCNWFRGPKEPKTDGLIQGLQKVIEDMDLIKKEAMEINTEKVVIRDQLQRNVSASTASLKSSHTIMVGNDEISLELMDKLAGGGRGRQVIPIVGMAGIGKTTLARYIYAQPLVEERFDICIWAKISEQFDTKEFLGDALCQANKEENKERLSKMREDKLGLALYQYLSTGRRFLIVMDDMWSIEAWNKIQFYFPDNKNSSRILVTTRLSKLGSQLDECGLEMKFLDDVSSWKLFSETVFRDESCPIELEVIGMKIVEKCGGLPLSIVVMGGLLEKLAHTHECWESVVKNLNSLVNLENDKYCLKILKMSYNHLPAYLKPCFLYMGVFEEDHAIRVSTLIKLWVCEGLIKPISGKSLETIAEEYLKDLIGRNLILVHELGSIGRIKYCKIHDLLRNLCLREAHKERFYHVIGENSTPEGMYSQRRIVIPRNTSQEKVCDVVLHSMSGARSLINDHERVHWSPNFRLLRTLKAYDRFTDPRHTFFLEDVFQLVNSRYLVFAADWYCIFPSSITSLWNLHTLIISPSKGLTAPVGIWEMTQIRHIEYILGDLYLPHPPRESTDIVPMENLLTLKGVTNFKCSDDVVRRIPNIEKLGIIYDGEANEFGSHDDYYCLKNLECLTKMKSLWFWDRSGSDDYSRKLTFPHSLKKLSLRLSLSFNCEDILENIGSLRHLQKLKLTNGSLRKWETVEGQFPNLKLLSLKSCFNLESWTTESSHFPHLEHLHLIGLRSLNKIQSGIGEIPTLRSILLENCNRTTVESLKKILKEQKELSGEPQPFQVRVVQTQSSFIELVVSFVFCKSENCSNFS